MVQLSRLVGAVWVMLDGDRPIGQVVAPAGLPALGPGGDTVLLRRTPSLPREASADDSGRRLPARIELPALPGPGFRRPSGLDLRQGRHPAAA